MEQDDPALRPSMPPGGEAQLRWLLQRNTDALLQVAAELAKFRSAVAGGPLPGGRWGTAIVALVVWLAAVTGGVTAIAWAAP
jgi:hypothetical protein